jgi:hypothetical protein
MTELRRIVEKLLQQQERELLQASKAPPSRVDVAAYGYIKRSQLPVSRAHILAETMREELDYLAEKFGIDTWTP